MAVPPDAVAMNRLTATNTMPRDPERDIDREVHGGPVRRDRREPPRTREMEYQGADDEENQDYIAIAIG